MRTVTTPVLVLPTAELTDQTVLLWSTTRLQQLANGAGGFAATRQAELRRAVATFPDQASVQYLRAQGINAVLLLRAYVPGTPWERAGDIPVDALNITREDLDDAVLFRLTPDPAQPSTTPPGPGIQPGTGEQPGSPTQPTYPTQPGVGGYPTQPTFPTQPGVLPTVQAMSR
jgi:hypothetical protein